MIEPANDNTYEQTFAILMGGMRDKNTLGYTELELENSIYSFQDW